MASSPVDVAGNLSLPDFTNNNYGGKLTEIGLMRLFLRSILSIQTKLWCRALLWNFLDKLGSEHLLLDHGEPVGLSLLFSPRLRRRYPDDQNFACHSSTALQGTILDGCKTAINQPDIAGSWTYTALRMQINTTASTGLAQRRRCVFMCSLRVPLASASQSPPTTGLVSRSITRIGAITGFEKPR
jgi:hypothetical protein